MPRKPHATMPILWRAFSPYRWQILFLSILGFLSSLLTAFGVGALIPLLSFFTQNQNSSLRTVRVMKELFTYLPFPYSMNALLLILVGIFFVRAGLLLIFGYIRAVIRYDYKNRVIKELLGGMMYVGWPFFLRQKIGHMQETILRDAEQSAKALESLAQVILSLSGVIVLSGFAVSLAPGTTALMALAGVCIILLFRPLVQRIRTVGRLLAEHGKIAAQYLSEHIIGMKTVKISAAERNVMNTGAEEFDMWKRLEIKKSFLGSISSVIPEPISMLFIALVLMVTYGRDDFNFEVFAATIFLIQRIFIYLESGQGAWYAINETIYHTVHILEFRTALEEHRESDRIGAPFVFNKHIEFKNVVFGYTPSKPVLQGVSFQVARGEIVGIVGPSGAGKTSIADLLMRLFDEFAGAITVDDKDIKSIDMRGWRKSIGYVSQDIFLLNASIRDNIRFYDDEVADKDIEAASHLANIYDVIKELPQKFDTIVGDRGVMLSAGQRQRIVLARALARHPQILLLDEATSALDNESELAIQESIRALRGSMTVIMIAHRLSTLVDADRVIALDGGKVIEAGSPQKLLEDSKSYFYTMYHAKDIV